MNVGVYNARVARGLPLNETIVIHAGYIHDAAKVCTWQLLQPRGLNCCSPCRLVSGQWWRQLRVLSLCLVHLCNSLPICSTRNSKSSSCGSQRLSCLKTSYHSQQRLPSLRSLRQITQTYRCTMVRVAAGRFGWGLMPPRRSSWCSCPQSRWWRWQRRASSCRSGGTRGESIRRFVWPARRALCNLTLSSFEVK